jgi:hypothetical protein
MILHARRHVLTVALAAAALAAAPSDASARGWDRYAVRNRLDAVGDAAGKGRFRISVRTHADERVVERMEFGARGLDATRDTGGALPEYRVFLVNADESVAADFGETTLDDDGNARFRFDSRFDAFPDGIGSLSAFLGGKAQLRLGDTVVLEADVPEAAGIDDEPGDGQGAFAVRTESFRADGSDRKLGQLLVRYATTARGVNEQIRIDMRRLDESAAPYNAFLVDGVNPDVDLGELDPNQRRSHWTRDVDSRKGDDVPGDDVRDLAGQTVEIRDKDANVVATATMPSFE